MRASMLRGLVVLGVILALPLAGYAQEQSVRGTVTDTTGGVLPGVTVVAQNDATGNVFVGFSDGTGVFNIPVLIGTYTLTSELPGFQTLVTTDVQVLVGQISTVAVSMGISTLEETITVSGEAPLLDTTTSALSGNIDARQMEELPVNGRNWMDLSLLAPGSRQNEASEVPQNRQGYFQVVVDGQQVTQMICCASQQPRFSKDAIAEFELVTNRFDATQGRSAGMIVNAVTKSGTNIFAGTLSGYFRDDNFIAEDFIQQRVLPYSNTQVATTAGGPIVQDRVHFFANYEYEREPSTVTFNSPFPGFNIDLGAIRTEHKGGGRLDVQFTNAQRASVRYANYFQNIPNNNTGGSSRHPSTQRNVLRYSDQLMGSYTAVIGNSAVNEFKAGMVIYDWTLDTDVNFAGGSFPGAKVRDGGAKRISFRDYDIGTATNTPQELSQDMLSFRNDFSFSYEAMGRHDVKVGGEYMYNKVFIDWCNRCNGWFRMSGNAPANAEELFPVWNDASTWDYSALNALGIRQYFEGVGDFSYGTDRHMSSYWLQDDWQVSNRVTLNIGLRYDVDIGVQGEKVQILPWLSGNRSSDMNNFGPRVGTAIRLDDQTVLRGGYGLYFTQLENDGAHQPQIFTQIIQSELRPDGRADFAENPWNGPVPNYDVAFENLCEGNGLRDGCITRSITTEIPSPDHAISYSHQASVGIQRQIGDTMSYETNYVFTGGRKEEDRYNINLNWDAATGINIPFGDQRRYPDWGAVEMEFMGGFSNYHGWENAFTKRFSDNWQLSVTYTLAYFRDSIADPRNVILTDYVPGAAPSFTGSIREEAYPFSPPADLGEDYTLAEDDQRHRAVVNAIWDVGMGFQVSGLYFYGSGMRFDTDWGSDLRDVGEGGYDRLHPDGSILPRNDFTGDPIHRMDLRLRQRVPVGGGVTVDGMFEVFNLFNHENYGSYNTRVSSSRFGTPGFNRNVVYLPRMAQFGFRLGF
jgi:hypothetical protein